MNLILLVLAILCGAIAAMMGFNWIASTNWPGWLALSLVFFEAAHLVGDRGLPIAVTRRAPQ